MITSSSENQAGQVASYNIRRIPWPMFLVFLAPLVWLLQFDLLFDDAMISMRYARNFARGHGLVWNPGGERVEGFTNPAWVLILALVHLGTNNSVHAIRAVQAISAACLVANLILVWHIARRLASGRIAVPLIACLLTSLYYPLNYWALTGNEVGLAMLVTTAAIGAALRYVDCGFIPAWFWLALSLVVFIRLDMAVVYITISIYLFWFVPSQRQNTTVSAALWLVVMLGAQTALRIWYYGDALPNTYYLKMTGFPAGLRILRGAVFSLFYVVRSLWPMWMLAILLFFLNRRRGPVIARSPASLLLGMFVAQAAYSAYVGGDAWERVIGCNRFISVAMPGMFIVTAALVSAAGNELSSRFPFGQHMTTPVYLLLCGIILINLHTVPRMNTLRQWLFLEEAPYAILNRENVRLGVELGKLTTPGALITTDWAGTIPYFADRTTHDMLGKCDRRIAREPMHRYVMTRNPLLEFYPGHLKWNYAYSIGELEPDIVFARWGRSIGDSGKYLADNYTTETIAGLEVHVRRGSPHIIRSGEVVGSHTGR